MAYRVMMSLLQVGFRRYSELLLSSDLNLLKD